MKDDDGGPAFPVVTQNEAELNHAVLGMSLRDYFAGQVIHSCLEHELTEVYLDAATMAYSIADAMIYQRSKETA